MKKKERKIWDGKRKDEMKGENKWTSVEKNTNRMIIAVEEEKIQEEECMARTCVFRLKCKNRYIINK